MPYLAAGLVVIATPDEARIIVETGGRDVALKPDTGLGFTAIDGALYCALRALALERAPHALGLFARHWYVDERGQHYLVEGEHGDVLEGDDLARAIAATDALLLECQTHPERIAAILAAADLPDGLDADDAEAALRGIAGSPAPATLTEANAAFKAHYATDHLSTVGLYVWLRAFATCMRQAYATRQAVVCMAFL